MDNQTGTIGSAPEQVGTWPVKRHSIIDWLIKGTLDERYIDNIFVELCERLMAAGIPVARGWLYFNTLHPQWMGARILWTPGLKDAELTTIGFGAQETPQYLRSPLALIDLGAEEIRCHLEDDASTGPDYRLYDDLRREGYTDYVVWPLLHTLGKRHAVSFGSKRPGGFSEDDITFLRDLMPALALVSEIRTKNILARTMLETYVGPHASEQILAGATRCGSGVTVNAAVLICDLRNFTEISNMWPRDDVIEMLNGYFDAMAEPITTYGGEILKFMGDGLLAIFPLSDPDAPKNLLQAIRTAQSALAALNAQSEERGRPNLGYGIGVHAGDVMYGNIGARSRLDFTAIGPVVNMASRLETLTKEVGRQVLLSSAFVELSGGADQFEAMGSFSLRGLGEPVDVFALQGSPQLA